MKTKIKAASIVFAITASMIAAYLVGCSARLGGKDARDGGADVRQKAVLRVEQSNKRIADTLMQNALDAAREGKYEDALEEINGVIALDQTNDKALTLKEALEDMIYFREEGKMRKDKVRAQSLLDAPNSGIPYADEVTYPKKWSEIVARPTRPREGLPGPGGGYADRMGVSSGRSNDVSYALPPDQAYGALPGPSDGIAHKRFMVDAVEVDMSSVTADEIWVIAKKAHYTAPADDERPGCGAMMAVIPDEEKEIPLPLKHTDVKGQISGYIATVEVTQQFHNPYDEKIEAVYIFPLPQNAAINEFIMVIGNRKIRGIIRERKEAERIYHEARRQGHTASLLTQERPNIFTQKVANIEPGKQIDVNIKYFNTLAYVDGWYEFVFPMVVGPRFNPPCTTDGIGAVARGKRGISGQKTEIQYLKPNERSGHDISLALDIDAGVPIEEIKPSNHAITKQSGPRNTLTVKLHDRDTIPNKDFVLRYRVAGKRIKSALAVHRDKRGGYFTLMLYPPENLSSVRRSPMEMIFVLDCSGSMRGKPIAKAKDAIRRALIKLEPNDTFQIIRFSNNASQLGPQPIPATDENIRKGLRYVEALKASGGTMMIEAIKAAL
ncbi:MAG: VIT and vWA domain-containing protein, partial [Planctomycetota bacterium]